MADQTAKFDQNSRTTLLAVTDDSNAFIQNLLVNASTGRLKVSAVFASGNGITSINADTTAAQLLVTGSAGTDFAIVNNGTGTHTFNIPTASASNRGLLSSADWTTFNSKVSSNVTTLSSLASIGTITTGVWNGTIISPVYGGTGINNGSNTLTLGGSATFSGAYASTFVFTGITNVTFPTSGTLTALGNTTTGSGSIVLATSPTLTTPNIGAATATTVNGLTITTTTGILTITNLKTLSVSNTLTLAGTDGTTMTFPTTSATIARTDAAQTFTGIQTFSTIAAPSNASVNMASGTYNTIQTYSPSASGTATLDLSKGNIHHITMPAGNITIALSNGTAGQCFIVRILQDGSGSRTVTWFTTIKWAGGSAPTLTTTASKADTLGFEITGSSTYDGFVVGQNI